MVVNVLKFVKVVNVVLIGHVVAVCRVNVDQEKYVNQTSVCVVHDRVDVVHMNIAFKDDVFAEQVSAINVTMHVKSMKSVSMENVFAKNGVKKVENVRTTRCDFLFDLL